MENNNITSDLPKAKNRKPLVYLLFVLVMIIFSIGGFYLGRYSNRTLKQTTTDGLKQDDVTAQLKIEPIVSPSGTYKLSFINGQKFFFDGSREWKFGKYTDQDFIKPEIVWSPDETWMTIKYSSLDYLVNTIYRLPGADVVFESIGQLSIYWSDSDTAYISYQPRLPIHKISKFVFSKESNNPEETVIYEEDRANARYAYVPAAISPDGKYLILEQRYEFGPTLWVLNTVTKKVKSLSTSEEVYAIGNNPNYRWSGNTVTFMGGLTEKGIANEKLFKDVSVDLSGF